ALLAQVGFGFINLVFTVLALIVIDRVGRRPLLISGMAVVTFALLAIGFVFLFVRNGAPVSRAVGLWIGGLICVYIAAIALSICAVIWVLTPEIFPNRVRGRAMSLATFANWTTNAFSAWAFPWYVAKYGMPVFFFTAAAICLIALSYYWTSVPETKGRSLEDIENLWADERAGAKRETLPGSELA
ncbi:MAG: MFS transporter, partial [Limisphaerales bacterium]